MLRVDADGRTTWTNWAATATSRPTDVVHPASTAEVAAVIAGARERGLRVKAIGSGHSFTPVGITDGVLVELDRLTGIVNADAESGLVRVKGGTRLRDLNRALAALGLAMTNLGDIDRQTITGALATGTHGTGARFAGLASFVRAAQIVLADGAVVEVDADHDPDLFEAARISLGALGVVTEITLQCQPAFLVNAKEQPARLAETLDQLDDLADGTDHFEFFWFPHTDRVLTKRNTRLPGDAAAAPLPSWRAWLDDDLLSNRFFERVCRVSASRPQWVPRINAVSSRVLSAREFTAPSYAVFASIRDVRFREMEYSVPRTEVRGLIERLVATIDQRGFRLPFPVEVRFTAGDSMWLSTATGRESAYVAVHQYQRMDHRAYFDAFEALALEVGGRPHWGKMHSLGRDQLQARYPRFDDFIAVRDRVDPDRTFTNDHLERILGP